MVERTPRRNRKTVRLTLHIPPDPKDWLREQVRYHGGSFGSEVTLYCRAAMEADANKKRVDAADAVRE
jgi:hypothetical protein